MLRRGSHQNQSMLIFVGLRAAVFIGRRIGFRFRCMGRTRQTVKVFPLCHLPLLRTSKSMMPTPMLTIKGMVCLSSTANATRRGHGMTRRGLVQCKAVLQPLIARQSHPKSITKSKTTNCPAQRVVPHHQARSLRRTPTSRPQAMFQLTISLWSLRIYLLTCSVPVKRPELVGSTDIVQEALAECESFRGETSRTQRRDIEVQHGLACLARPSRRRHHHQRRQCPRVMLECFVRRFRQVCRGCRFPLLHTFVNSVKSTPNALRLICALPLHCCDTLEPPWV